MKPKHLGAACVAVLLTFATVRGAVSGDVSHQGMVSLSGAQVQAIDAALPVFTSKGLALGGFDVVVFEGATSVLVTFVHGQGTGVIGQTRNLSGTGPSFQVEVSKGSGLVIGSSFVR